MTARSTPDGPQDGDQDEARQVREAAGGSVKAFECLYRRYERRIYALCLRMTGSRDQAEDCVQETFVQAWQKLANFEGRSAFGTWLHRIAVNKVLSVQRYDSRRPRLAPVDETLSDPYGASPSAAPAGAGVGYAPEFDFQRHLFLNLPSTADTDTRAGRLDED